MAAKTVMPKSMAAGLCTGCRKCGEDSKKARCTCFKSELSTIIASAASFGAALDGGAAAAAAAATAGGAGVAGNRGAPTGVGDAASEPGAPHAVPHGGAPGTCTGGTVVAGTARVAEALPLPAL